MYICDNTYQLSHTHTHTHTHIYIYIYIPYRSCATVFQCTPSILFQQDPSYIILPCMTRSLGCCFSTGLPHQNPARISLHTCYIPRPTNSPSFGRQNIWQALKIIKLLFTLFFSVPYYFIFSSASYSRTLSAHVPLWMSEI
jgi:hypothetical protein